MRVRVPKPPRTFREMDELVALIDGAGEQDTCLARISRERLSDPTSTAARVAALLAEGERSTQTAQELGKAKSTIGWHIKRLGVEGSRDYVGRRAIVSVLGGAGLRVSELCDVRIAEVRLHDPSGARLRIPDSKTEAGVRDVELSPDLVEELVAHIDRLRRVGQRTNPESYLFPHTRGGRISRQRVSRIVSKAAERATEQLVARGLPPLPNTTPHSLRRTYVSIALLANNFDVMFVMSQVGHSDSKMTMDVYAKLQQRARREHGEAFDRLVRTARERLYGTDPDDEKATEARSIRARMKTRKHEMGVDDHFSHDDDVS
jgi:integrase